MHDESMDMRGVTAIRLHPRDAEKPTGIIGAGCRECGNPECKTRCACVAVVFNLESQTVTIDLEPEIALELGAQMIDAAYRQGARRHG